MLKGHDERDMVAMLEYNGKGTIQVDGQPCTLTKSSEQQLPARARTDKRIRTSRLRAGRGLSRNGSFAFGQVLRARPRPRWRGNREVLAGSQSRDSLCRRPHESGPDLLGVEQSGRELPDPCCAGRNRTALRSFASSAGVYGSGTRGPCALAVNAPPSTTPLKTRPLSKLFFGSPCSSSFPVKSSALHGVRIRRSYPFAISSLTPYRAKGHSNMARAYLGARCQSRMRRFRSGRTGRILVGASGFELPASWSRTIGPRTFSNLQGLLIVATHSSMLRVFNDFWVSLASQLVGFSNASMHRVGTKMGTVVK